MPYSVDWYIQDEIIYSRYFGALTPDELRECLILTREFIESSPRESVHTINDVSDVTESVALLDSLPIIREVGSHARVGWSFTLGEKSPLVKMGAAMGASVFKIRYKAFDTLDQVIEHLKFFDQNISWEKADEAVIQGTKI
jgi:hypothetical protein